MKNLLLAVGAGIGFTVLFFIAMGIFAWIGRWLATLLPNPFIPVGVVFVIITAAVSVVFYQMLLEKNKW